MRPYYQPTISSALLPYSSTTVLPQEPPSLANCVRWIARLGGFLGRKSDGEPGVKTLWLGLQRVHDMASIWQLMSKSDQ
jgi:hypothetical protein